MLESLPARSIISEGQFVYGPNVDGFDLAVWLANRPSKLDYLEPIVDAQAGYYSVNPKVLLTIIELQTGLFTSDDTKHDIENIVLFEDVQPGLDKQIEQLAQQLTESFYWHLYVHQGNSAASPTLPIEFKDGTILEVSSGVNDAGTFAVQSALASLAEPETWLTLVTPEANDGFLNTYRRLFPGDDPLDTTNNIKAPNAPPVDLLRLPFLCNDSWSFVGGPHAWDGVSANPWSSIDFAPGAGSCQSPPTGDWVAAAADGTVTVYASCHVRINHAGGWSTGYYHLSSLQVSNGSPIRQGDRIANPSCAVCQGGSATGPHVHMGLLYNGAYVPISGTTISGWVVHAGSSQYEGFLQNGSSIKNVGDWLASDNCGSCCGCLPAACCANAILGSESVSAPLGMSRDSRVDGVPACLYDDESITVMSTLAPQDNERLGTGLPGTSESNITHISSTSESGTLPPSPPTGLLAVELEVGGSTAVEELHVVWRDDDDSERPLQGYQIAWSRNPEASAATYTLLSANMTSATSPQLVEGSWFVHLRAIDKNGSVSPTTSQGPYYVDRTAPYWGTPDEPTVVWTSRWEAPLFDWRPAIDEHEVAGYLLYWGENELGTDELLVTHNSYISSIKATPSDVPLTMFLRAAAVDSAGNLSSWWTMMEWHYDPLPPEATLTIGDGSGVVPSLHPILHINADDRNGEVTAMRFSDDGLNWTDWEAYNNMRVWQLENRPGPQTVFVQVQDGAGNLSDVITQTVTAHLTVLHPSSTSYTLARSVMAMGGGEKTSASYTVRGTSGQGYQTGRLQSAMYRVVSGFWGPPAIPCYDFGGAPGVDATDIATVASHWPAVSGNPGYDPLYDVDHDGDIDMVDIMTVASHWGEFCG